MKFQQYIDASWAQHDKNADELLKNYDQGFNLVETEAEVLALARLIHHVATEHNFKFDEAKVHLEKLKAHPMASSESVMPTLERNILTMNFLKDPTLNIESITDSNRAMIYIVAAASLLFQKKFAEVDRFIDHAVAAAEDLPDTDPAHRILAMSNNNMAAELSEKTDLEDSQKKLMIRTAQNSRKFWEKAGTWLNVERSEYGLSKYYLKLDEIENSKNHADQCLQICEREKAKPLEFFFAHERLAFICKAKKDPAGFKNHLNQMKLFFERAVEEDKTWMKAPLAAIEASQV